MIFFLKKYRYLFLVILVSLIANFRWLCFSIFSYSDQGFTFFNRLKEISLFGAWNNFGLGRINLLVWRLAAGLGSLMYGLFGILGFDSNIADKFLLMWPWIILSGIGSYFLVRKITKSDVGGLIGSFVFSFNTYFLAENMGGHLLLPVAFVFAVFSLLFFIKLLEERKPHLIVVTALLLFITGSYDLRSLYIVIWVLFFYALYYLIVMNKNSGYRKTLRKILVIFSPMIILFLLSIFWILVSLKIGTLVENSVLSRSLFGSSFFDITKALTLFHPFWTGGKIDWFIVQGIPFYFWLIPIFVSLGLILNRKNKNIVFFGIVALIGIFLSKQVAEPFGSTYKWLFENLLGFNAFREASKFYFLIALGYSVLIGSFVAWLWENWNKQKWQIYGKYFLTFLVVVIFLWNTKPIITVEIGSMFVPRHIPNDYLIFKDFILKQDDFFRTLWTPSYPKWAIYTNQKLIVSNVAVIGIEWKNYVSLEPDYKDWPNKIIGIFKIKGANELFANSSIKYVVVPVDDFANDADPFYYYGRNENPNIRDWYISELDKVEWLKKINIGTNELVVYENKNYKPHIYSDTGLNYYQTNASEFGDFSQNQNLYLNSGIEKHEYLLNNLDNVVVPIEADQDKVAEMKLAVDKAIEPAEKKKLQSDLDLYTNNSFLKDFKLKIPTKATYKIYLNQDSVLANNKNIGVKIDSHVLEKDEMEIDKEGWNYFNQIELDKGEHSFKLYIGNELIDYINSGDIVLSAEDLAEPIQTPQLEYKQINPTKYIVNVHQVSQSFPLIFSESFHPDWKIYVQPTINNQQVTTDKFISEEIAGTIQNENLDSGHFYDIFSRKPVLNDKHLLINGYANSWWVDIEELEKQGIIEKRADGTYDFSIIIEFEPQKYFYLGLGISGVTLLGCLGYLGFTMLNNSRFFRRRKK